MKNLAHCKRLAILGTKSLLDFLGPYFFFGVSILIREVVKNQNGFFTVRLTVRVEPPTPLKVVSKF